MPKDLHGQPLVTTLANSDRIAAGVPGQVGAKNQLFGDLLNQIKSWLDIAYMAIFTKVNSYPEIPETPENKVLSDSGDWVTMATATGGFASNLYFSNADSDIVGYKTLSYTFTDTPIEVSTPVIVGDGEKLVASYLYGSGVATDIYPGGQWAFNLYVKISAVVGVSNIGFRYFKYSSLGVKTFVFDAILWSDAIVNTAYAYKATGIIKGSFALDPTDRMGCDIYVKTTAASERTITYMLGDGNASYLNNPNAIRHALLRDKNGEAAYQHVTQGSQSFSGDKSFENPIAITEIAEKPAAPAAGLVKIYPKTDGKLYKLDDTGVEVEVGAAVGTTDDITEADALDALGTDALDTQATINAAINTSFKMQADASTSQELVFDKPFKRINIEQSTLLEFSLATTGNIDGFGILLVIEADNVNPVYFAANFGKIAGEFQANVNNYYYLQYIGNNEVNYSIGQRTSELFNIEGMAGLILYLDGSDTDTIIDTGSGEVTWTDKSNLADVYRHARDAYVPTYSAANKGWLLGSGKCLQGDAGVTIARGSYTRFFVFDKTAAGDNTIHGATSNGTWLLIRDTTIIGGLGHNYTYTLATGNSIICDYMNAARTDSYLLRNGSQVATVNGTLLAYTSNIDLLGVYALNTATQCFNGYLKACVVFNRILTADEIAKVFASLNTKFGAY